MATLKLAFSKLGLGDATPKRFVGYLVDGLVAVETRVHRGHLSEEDQAVPVGKIPYQVFSPRAAADMVNEALLDKFHGDHAIDALDDFNIWADCIEGETQMALTIEALKAWCNELGASQTTLKEAQQAGGAFYLTSNDDSDVRARADWILACVERGMLTASELEDAFVQAGAGEWTAALGHPPLED